MANDMRVTPYTPDKKEEWDEFVLRSNNGTMFHMQRFFDYHEPGKFEFDHLMIYNGAKLYAVLPGAVRGDAFESPIGASYGSIVHDEMKFKYALDVVDALVEWGRERGLKRFELTNAPLIYDGIPNQNIDFALLWRGAAYTLHYISSAVPLDPNRETIPRFQKSTRRNVRKHLHDPDVRVEMNEAYDEFYPILLENKSKHDVKPTHSLEDLYRLRELMPERLKLIMVYYKNEPVAGSLLFLPNDRVALCFYNMLRYEYDHLKPIYRVMYEVVEWATKNGYRHVDIGVSQDTKADNPMTPSMNLIDFKEKFDARTVMRNTLTLEL